MARKIVVGWQVQLKVQALHVSLTTNINNARFDTMDALYDNLVQGTSQDDAGHSLPSLSDPVTTSYLSRLSTLSVHELSANEPASLSQSSQSHVRNLQALSKRSHRAILSSSDHLSHLEHILPSLSQQAAKLRQDLPGLESEATQFTAKYERNTENAVLDRRKRAMLLSKNADRLWDVLDLPSLLASSVAAAQSATATSASGAATSYSAALDLSAHVKRLSTLYPQSTIVEELSQQAESEIQNLRSILIGSLTSPNLKLAAGMRTIGWLRRVAPELSEEEMPTEGSATRHRSTDGGLATLFLVCRLQTLHRTLNALEPLRELADQESHTSSTAANKRRQATQSSALGSQSERYLKRYIEVFREQSFSIISMYKSIFPTRLPQANLPADEGIESPLALPSPIVSFALHLVKVISSVLKAYMPNVIDKSARESLLTQVLYCAGSLGRLGADYGMLIALLEEELLTESGVSADSSAEPEWAQVMKKHRVQAGRLEILARGVGTSRKASGELPQSPATPA